MATATTMTSTHTETHSRRTPLRGIQMAILNYLNVRSINCNGMGVWSEQNTVRGVLDDKQRASFTCGKIKEKRTECEKNHYDVLLSLAFLLLFFFFEFMWLVNIHKTFYAHSFVVGMVRQPSFHDRLHVCCVFACVCVSLVFFSPFPRARMQRFFDS